MERSQIVKSVIQLVLLNICLPTLDVYSDIALVVRVFQRGHPHYAAILLFPLLLNFSFTWFTWWRVEKTREKYWTWLFVLAQVWPQYEAVKVMVMMSRGQIDGVHRKKMLDRDVASLEPFLESVPQVLVMTYFFFNLLVDKEEGLFWTKVIEDKAEERSVILGEDTRLFFVSYLLSILAASFGLAKFLKSGPCRILPDVGTMNGLCTIRFLLTFLAVAITLVAKGCVLAGLIMHNYFMDTPILTRVSMYFGTTKKEPPLALSICTTLLPQLLLSFLSLTITLGWGKTLWRTIANYPALLLLPVITHFTFGARKSRCCTGCCSEKCKDTCHGESQEELGQLVMSKHWTGLNILVSIVGVAVSFANVIWEIGIRRFWRADTVMTALPLIISFSLGYFLTILVLLLDCCGELQFGVMLPDDSYNQYVVIWRNKMEQVVALQTLEVPPEIYSDDISSQKPVSCLHPDDGQHEAVPCLPPGDGQHEVHILHPLVHSPDLSQQN